MVSLGRDRPEEILVTEIRNDEIAERVYRFSTAATVGGGQAFTFNQFLIDADAPITFIRNEPAPLLVLQGDNDNPVPKEEAEQVVAILMADGRTVDAHYYPNEGHGFVTRENQIDALERTIAWFENLKGEPRARAFVGLPLDAGGTGSAGAVVGRFDHLTPRPWQKLGYVRLVAPGG